MYKAVLKHVRDGVCASERCAGDLVGVLMVRVDTFPTAALVSLTDHYLELIKEGEPLQGRSVSATSQHQESVTYSTYSILYMLIRYKDDIFRST